jgi:hypothetical protein
LIDLVSTDPNRRARIAPDARQAYGGVLHRWRFAIVLFTSLLLAVGQPLVAETFDEQGTFDVAVSLLIMAVMLLSFEEREHRKLGLLLGLAAFLSLWTSRAFLDSSRGPFLALSYLFTSFFFAFALFGIVRTVLSGRATTHAILGAVCGYLLLGLVWSLVYSAVETLAPGSFGRSASDGAAPLDRSALSYYSFVTLSTVGYGDITPNTPLARTLSWIEAVTGQFYLAVLVAGLVGFKVSQGQRAAPDPGASDGDVR